MRQTINRGRTNYEPNSLANNDPAQVKAPDGALLLIRKGLMQKGEARCKSFFDHFSQARLFFNSQSDPEKNHLIDAFSFELGKLKPLRVRQRMIGILSLVDKGLAAEVAFALGLKVPNEPEQPINHSIPSDGDLADYKPLQLKGNSKSLQH